VKLAVCTQKGGVGKTTTAVNLSACLAKLGKSVLLIDADPQAAATSGLGFQRAEKTIYDALLGKCRAEDAILKTGVDGLELLPSCIDLAAAELELADAKDREFRLAKTIFGIRRDFVIIDTPPNLGLMTVSALVASDAVLIPVQAEYYPLEGLAHLLRFLKALESRLGRGLRKMVLITMFDSRLKICREVEKQLRSFLKDSVLKTVIPRNVRLAEAPSHGKPVILYDPSCPGARAYMRLAEEVISIAEGR
jgi:chromosome partitioning protein